MFFIAGTEISMQELAEKILKATNSEATIEYIDSREDDPKQRQPDITLAKKLLNWQPQTSLEEGLQKTIQYFRNL